MRRLLGLVAIAVMVALGFQLLQEATEYRGGHGAPGEQTTITFRVRTKNLNHANAVAARALWQTCVNSISWTSVSQPTHISGNTYRAEAIPALASDTKRRLSGCLNEATLSRVQGHVESAVDGPAPR